MTDSTLPTPSHIVPLLSSHHDYSGAVEQVLGGESYRIDTSQLMVRLAQKNPLWKTAIKSCAILLATPILIPTIVLYSVSMWIGPGWWRSRVTATMVPAFMKEVAELFDPERTELLRGIGPNDTLLDLGAGSGAYLKFLSRGGHLVAIEPCVPLHETYRRRMIEAGLTASQVELHACDIETYVRTFPEREAAFDWIILGNVLCEVDDQASTLHCANLLLKPGGRLYFSEHIGMPKGTWARRVQDLINPWWRTAGAGCNCNRDSLVSIRNNKGWQVISWTYFGFSVCLGPFVLGLAMKNPLEVEQSK